MVNFIDCKLYLDTLDSVLDDFPLEPLNGKTILITGANGMIASFLIDCIMRHNVLFGGTIKIAALCRSEEKTLKRFNKYTGQPLIKFIFADVCLPLEESAKYDYIIHAASNAHPAAYAVRPADTMKANLLGTLNLLENAVMNKAEKFMFISSGEIYGVNNSSDENPLDETYCGYINIGEARSSYPESKRAAEALCLAYKGQFGINTAIARPWYVYGPTMTGESTKADAQFLRNAVNKENIVLKSAGNDVRSYCYVSDCVNALFRILLSGEGAYNINGADNISIKQFAEISANAVGTKVIYTPPEETEKRGFGAATNAVLSGDKIKKLGYTAKITADKGIPETIKILDYIGGCNGT